MRYLSPLDFQVQVQAFNSRIDLSVRTDRCAAAMVDAAAIVAKNRPRPLQPMHRSTPPSRPHHPVHQRID